MADNDAAQRIDMEVTSRCRVDFRKLYAGFDPSSWEARKRSSSRDSLTNVAAISSGEQSYVASQYRASYLSWSCRWREGA
jgi:hypothetical protein